MKDRLSPDSSSTGSLKWAWCPSITLQTSTNSKPPQTEEEKKRFPFQPNPFKRVKKVERLQTRTSGAHTPSARSNPAPLDWGSGHPLALQRPAELLGELLRLPRVVASLWELVPGTPPSKCIDWLGYQNFGPEGFDAKRKPKQRSPLVAGGEIRTFRSPNTKPQIPEKLEWIKGPKSTHPSSVRGFLRANSWFLVVSKWCRSVSILICLQNSR